ncbi:hypothetical protein VSDG_08243 [Cytospora chrysosperma]|uniref:Uncharacterized protein n=1 Tax=Cytospora chrysosperma TaxID=252740 RepID=A0A423VG50_CYTCH|nr:hypothetical protein VSDG_08243 [Valsa sordida]
MANILVLKCSVEAAIDENILNLAEQSHWRSILQRTVQIEMDGMHGLQDLITHSKQQFVVVKRTGLPPMAKQRD